MVGLECWFGYCKINQQKIEGLYNYYNLKMEQSDIVKLYDKLFIGDQVSARDQQFILKNHIACIINMTHQFVPNYFQHYGITYLTLSEEVDDSNLEDVYDQFVGRTHQEQVVFIHGGESIEQPCLLASVFMMHRFRWSLYKTLQFMQSRIPSLIFTQPSFQILKKMEMELLNQQVKLTYNWEVRPSQPQQLIIRNTYLNSAGRQYCKNTKRAISKDISTKRVSRKDKRVSFNIDSGHTSSNISLLQSSCSSQSLSSQAQIKNKILVSVRKILSQAANQHSDKLSLKDVKSQSATSLKKHKSSYLLASMKSLSKKQSFNSNLTASTQLIPSEQPNHSISMQKPRNNSTRLQTQMGQSSQNKYNLPLQKQKMKTEGGQAAKPVIDICLKRQENMLSGRSLPKKEKENRPPLSRVQTRKPTPSKVAQIFAKK